MAPRVLIADKLSPTAVQIFKDRGVETNVKTGLERDELIKIIGDYDGIAIRSATKITATAKSKPRCRPSKRWSTRTACCIIRWCRSSRFRDNRENRP